MVCPAWSLPAAVGCAFFVVSTVPLPAQRPVTEVARACAPLDIDGDGTPELRRLEVVAEAGDTKAPGVVVFVEARLLAEQTIAVADVEALRSRLRRHADDLEAQGLHAMVVTAEVHTGPPHQDGLTLLALRRFLRACHAESPLAGALLVGHFPDALLVRTCNWRRQEVLTLPDRDGKAVQIAATTTNVRCVPEYVAHRCDIVLADLDGEWEAVYQKSPTALPSVTAVFGESVPDAGGTCVAMQTSELKVEDVFQVRDGGAAVDREGFAVTLDAADRDHECTTADRALGNPLAQPELAVSRLDARGVALMPEARALDADGRPQAVELAAGDAAKGVHWRHDQALELRLLCEYFDRNHSFRTQPLPAAQHKPASISWGLGSGLGTLRTADPAWAGFAEAGYDECEHTDLVKVVQWLQRPAVLRTLRAHSDPWCAAFEPTDVKVLEAAVGGPPWHWRRVEQRLVPSLAGNAGGRADYFFYRTLWQHHVLPDHPYLLVHTGCEALSPPGACELPFDDPGYGLRQHAESMLFFTPCLAIVGRAKVFYDEPRGFCEALAAGATFGDAWRRYFAIEAAAANWDEAGGDIGRKRAYFWSVLGDWTLRLRGQS